LPSLNTNVSEISDNGDHLGWRATKAHCLH